MKKTLPLALAAVCFCVPLFSQEALKSTEEEYYDFLSLTGITERPTLGYRTLSDSEWNLVATETPVLDADGNAVLDEDGNPLTETVAPEHVWQHNNLGTKRTLWQSQSEGENYFTRGFNHALRLKIYGPEWYNSYNTAAPYGQNDGALWQGKGYNTSLTAGARLEVFGFEVTIKPQVSFSQNRSFELMPAVSDSEYSYFQGGIDLPQRFGDDSFWTFDWGDTEIRWTWRNLTAGFGTQSPWLGPAWLNPMLGSNNAATYPKVDFGLRKTAVHLPWLGWYIGDIEGRVWVGRLEESDYFDNNPDNDYRLLNAISLSFAPAFIPGLTIGVNRIFVTDWAAHNLTYIGRLFTLSRSNGSQVGTHEDEDQKVALFADWQISKVGFEAYGELGIDDFSPDSTENPFHTAIYTVGVKQHIPIFKRLQAYVGELRSELILEWNNFEMSTDYLALRVWQYPGYYAHGSILQGYTQKGQIIGAGSGYFGNSQFLGYRIYHPHGSVMFFMHRNRPDNNYTYNKSMSDPLLLDDLRFFTLKSLGVEAVFLPTKNITLTGTFVSTYMRSWHYEKSERTFFFALKAKYAF